VLAVSIIRVTAQKTALHTHHCQNLTCACTWVCARTRMHVCVVRDRIFNIFYDVGKLVLLPTWTNCSLCIWINCWHTAENRLSRASSWEVTELCKCIGWHTVYVSAIWNSKNCVPNILTIMACFAWQNTEMVVTLICGCEVKQQCACNHWYCSQ
jgi:hypothetical protein